MIFNRTVKNITRIGEVINILLRFGFEDVISNTALRKFMPPKKIAGYNYDKAPHEYTRWERIRMVIEELGTTYIKLAQLLSNRPDILPEPLIREFSKLQSSVPPFSTKEAKKIIEAELGQPIDKIFSYFDNRTIGAGSVGQVHRARLLRGEDVVVKVRRPGAEYKVRTDLILMREFARYTENYFHNIGVINPLEIIDTFEESMLKELDYKNETLNMLRFRRVYAKDTDFYVPKPYPELSSSKVLVVEFAAGCEIDDIQQLAAWGINSQEMAEKMTAVYLRQIFENGYFHADPHSGNVLVRPNKQIILIDFGMVGKLSKQQKYDFAGVSLSIAQKNAKTLALNLRKLAAGGEVENIKIFENDLEYLLDDYAALTDDGGGVSELIGRLQKVIYDYKLRVPGIIFVILRALAILEGIGRKMHPDYQMMKFMEPYGRKIFAEQFSIHNIQNEISYSSSQLISLLYSAPVDLKYILYKLRKGELRTVSHIEGLEPAVKQLNTSTNRFAAALMISAALIASSVIMLAAPQNMIYFLGMPLLSAIGFGGAAVGFLWLIINALRNRRRF